MRLKAVKILAKINKKRKKLVFFRKKLYFCEHIDLFLTIYRIMT